MYVTFPIFPISVTLHLLQKSENFEFKTLLIISNCAMRYNILAIPKPVYIHTCSYYINNVTWTPFVGR
jgi:hypothetical protein